MNCQGHCDKGWVCEAHPGVAWPHEDCAGVPCPSMNCPWWRGPIPAALDTDDQIEVTPDGRWLRHKSLATLFPWTCRPQGRQRTRARANSKTKGSIKTIAR
jgi:hypothetical protein